MARAWYIYIGGDPFVPSSYVLSPVEPTCRIGWTICAIYVPYQGQFPGPLSENIQQYIIIDLATGVPQPQVPGSPFFVLQKVT